MRNPFETEERRAFRAAVKRFTEEEVKPYVNEWDEAGAIPWAIHEKVGALGCFGFGVDEQYGGLGFEDPFMRLAFAEELAQGGAGGVLAALGGRSISIAPIHQLGSEALKARVLPDVLAGKKSSCLAITEPSGGSDVANLKTTATKDGDHYVIDGQKTFITTALESDYFVVAARTGDPGLSGISLFFVEKGTPGFSMTPLKDKMGWWCSSQATLYFDKCRVPASQLLGDENMGFISIMRNFNFERLAIIGQSLGTMKLCFDESVAWAKERVTFGKPLIKHQVIRHKLAEMSARIDVCEAYALQICAAIEAGEHPIAEICKAKFFTTKAFEYVASEAMQILGGAGYLRGNPVERAYREVKVLAIGGGSEEIMRDLAVRQMGL